MVQYEFIREVDSGREYRYFPEGNREAPGIIYLEANGDGRVIEVSKEDIGKLYAFHAIRSIDLSKKSGTIAWY